MIIVLLRLSEYSEVLILSVHRCLVIIFSATLTSVSCKRSYGLCRPMPIYNYLGDIPSTTKYTGEPVSSNGNLVLVLAILLMQSCIEIEKFRISKLEKQVTQVAVNAKKNIDTANSELKRMRALSAILEVSSIRDRYLQIPLAEHT